MVRAYLVLAKPKKLGHVVMLGPPNKGSKVVDVTQALAGFEWVSGPADRQLSTDPKSPPNQLPSITFSLGIISGRVSFNPLYSSFI
jgi:triacylglycerol lipase